MDPETYYRLLSFDQMTGRPEVEVFFRRETFFTGADFASLRTNLKQLASQLHQRCATGRSSSISILMPIFRTSRCPESCDGSG